MATATPGTLSANSYRPGVGIGGGGGGGGGSSGNSSGGGGGGGGGMGGGSYDSQDDEANSTGLVIGDELINPDPVSID